MSILFVAAAAIWGDFQNSALWERASLLAGDIYFWTGTEIQTGLRRPAVHVASAYIAFSITPPVRLRACVMQLRVLFSRPSFPLVRTCILAAQHLVYYRTNFSLPTRRIEVNASDTRSDTQVFCRRNTTYFPLLPARSEAASRLVRVRKPFL